MSYVVESGSSQRSRKRRRTAITLLVVVAMLAMAFYYASTYFKGATPGAAAACPTPTATSPTTSAPAGAAPAPAPAPGKITVNVYNATGRNGLAGDTAKLVKDRGFVIGTVANDPLRKAVAGPAEVRFGKNGEASSKVVLALVEGATPVSDARADASVDLVLGSAFKALAAPPAAPGATTGAPAPATSSRC